MKALKAVWLCSLVTSVAVLSGCQDPDAVPTESPSGTVNGLITIGLPGCDDALVQMRDALIQSGVAPTMADRLLSGPTHGSISVQGPNAEERVRAIKRTSFRRLLLRLAEQYALPPSRLADILAIASPCFSPVDGPQVELDIVVEDGSGFWPFFDPTKEVFEVGDQGEDLTYRLIVSNNGTESVSNLTIINLIAANTNNIAFQQIDNISVDFNLPSVAGSFEPYVFSETASGFAFWWRGELGPSESITIIFSGLATAPGIGINRVLITADQLGSVLVAEEPTVVLPGICQQVTVPATAGGRAFTISDGLAPQPTGVFANFGNTVSVSASGTITIFGSDPEFTNDPDGFDFSSATGFDFLLTDELAPRGESATVAGGLIGRIGTGDFLYLGRSLLFTAQSSGEIELAINDIRGSFSDNLGEFSATVCVLPGTLPTPFTGVWVGTSIHPPSGYTWEISLDVIQQGARVFGNYSFTDLSGSGGSGTVPFSADILNDNQLLFEGPTSDGRPSTLSLTLSSDVLSGEQIVLNPDGSTEQWLWTLTR